jgi:UDP-N-acetylglucosamine 2-epimerase (non-hydrolysing)
MFKICTLVGTRPELIKLSRLIPKLDLNFNHILVHSGQNYDYNLNKIFFKDLKIRKPDFFLNVKSHKLSKMIGNIISKTDDVLDKIRPDALLVYGDTNTSLGIISAKRRKIPIFHMEAGNRCHDQRVPEEINRKIADHLSDVNIVISSQARENLISEGLKREMIFKFGSHMKEVIDFNIQNIKKSKILTKLKLKKDTYILVSLHREENVDNKERLYKIISQLNKFSLNTKIKIIISTHPRTRIRLKKFKISGSNLSFLEPFGFFDYCHLQINSYCTISDSGTIFEESSILNFPAITIRPSHERQEGIDGGTVLIHNINYNDIKYSIKLSRDLRKEKNFEVPDYYSESVSDKITNLVHSYIPIINNNGLGKIIKVFFGVIK